MSKAKFQSKQEFIDWTHSDDFRLSASSLASFYTPWSFMAYHLKERKETAAMLEGKLIHCMVLEREKLEENFIKMPADITVPSSAQQKKFCDLILYGNLLPGEVIKTAYASSYAKYTVKAALSAYKDFRAYIAFMRTVGGRSIVTAEVWDDWQNVALQLLKNSAVKKVISKCDQFEMKLEFNYEGFNFLGFIDAWGWDEKTESLYILDIKKRVTAEPRKIQNEIKYGDIGRQLAIYAIGLSMASGKDISTLGQINVGIVSVDAQGDTSVVMVTGMTLLGCIDALDKRLDKLKTCIMFEDWEASWEYNSDNKDGFYFA